MARPRLYERITIDDIDMKGHGVAHVDGYTLFVSGALPGDVVDISIRRRRSGHAVCRLRARHHDGIARITPFCDHFYDCGGCVWQDIPYEDQCELKARIVDQAFLRYGALDRTVDQALDHTASLTHHTVQRGEFLGCEQTAEYRNRLDYSFSSRRWISRAEVSEEEEIATRGALGFHAPRRFDKVVEIERCYLQGSPTNRIRNAVAEYTVERGYTYHDAVANEGLLRNLVVRTSLAGEVMVLLVLGIDDDSAKRGIAGFIETQFPEVTSCYCMINTSKNDDIGKHEANLLFGKASITERCGHINLQIHPKSFYQTNPGQAERLFQLVSEWADLNGGEHLLDLYCGIGSIGLFLAAKCARVTGLEIVPEAIECARENAMNNNIENAEFIVGAAEEALAEWAALGEVPDIVVVDPPRAGLHKKVIEALKKMKSPRILYVSCNPRSQAEDVAALLDLYELCRYRPADMFPHTKHVENVAELRLR